MENYNRYMNYTESELIEAEWFIWDCVEMQASELKSATDQGDLVMASKMIRSLDHLEMLWNDLQDEISYRIALYQF